METHLEMRNQASESAEVLYEYIADWIAPKSVVDVGCGNGAWLKAWSEKRLNDFLGLDDGGYLDPAHLLILSLILSGWICASLLNSIDVLILLCFC